VTLHGVELRRSRTIAPPISAGGRRPPRRRRRAVSHSACWRCRPPCGRPLNGAPLRSAPWKSKDVFSLRFWLPASIHHPGPPPQPLAPLRYGQGSEHFSSSSRCAPTKSVRDAGLPRRPRALVSLLTPETAKKRGRAKGQATS